MKHLHKPAHIIILGLIVIKSFGQTQTKTYSETFKVGSEAVLELNTSNADIEFDTWNKNQVSVVAVVEIEGLTPQEAENYFRDHEVKIIGNSKKIEVSTGGGYNWNVATAINLEGLNIDIPEIPKIEPFLLEIPEMSYVDAMPPVPVAPIPPFDYNAYKEDGEKYLQEWQNNVQRNYGEDYRKKMEDWAEKMKVKREQMEKKRKEMAEVRAKAREQMEEARSQQREAQQIAREKQHEAMAEQRVQKDIDRITFLNRDSGDNIYFRYSDGMNKNIKIKKTIKIKMPKSVRLKMNVRHGEVKLAENTKNMSANLSYATLLASTIDGVKTNIMASYSPVTVKNWNEGQLQADYSENVDLKQVKVLTLNSISSNVTIDQMLNSALIKNSFGALNINYVSPDFSDLTIFLENTDLACTLPQSAFHIQINSTASDLKPPAGLTLKKSEGNKEKIEYKGYHIKETNEREITINSKYSDIVLK